jgi:outer membrane protein assembly factor BamB
VKSALLAAVASVFTSASAGDFDWPQWGGPDRSNVSKETALLKVWPEGGPKQVWIYRNAGSGYSGPAIVAGKLFTMGTRDNSEILIALDANTGAELWTSKIGPILENDWGNGPRGTPTVDGERVYAMGGKGDLVCAAATDGKELWRAGMASLGGEIPAWGYTESPLVDGDRVICTPGGSKGAIAALDKNTGKVLWQSAQFKDPAQYSSAILASPGGKRQYVQLTMKSLVGISANDGKLLWKSEWPGRVAVIPTPIFHDDHVYITSGYGVGCKLVKLTDGSAAADVYENKVMKNHHGGVVRVGDHLYGHSDGPGWVCQDFKKGNEVWSEKKALGKGAITCADDRLYCLGEDDGTVVLAEASPKEWAQHGRFKLSPQTTIRKSQGRIWTHPVVSNGKLYLRDQDLVFCYDVARR